MARPVTNAEFLRFVAAHPQWRRDRVAPRVRRPRLSRALAGPDALAPGDRRAQPVTRVSWFAAKAYCEAQARAAAALDRMGIRRGRGRARAATRAAIPHGASASSPGTRDPLRRAAAGGGREARRTPTACATCTASSGNGPTTTRRCWCPPTIATQGDPRPQRASAAPARSSVADREQYAVLMRVAMLSSLEAAATRRRTLDFVASRRCDEVLLMAGLRWHLCCALAARTRDAAAARLGLSSRRAAADRRAVASLRLGATSAASRRSCRCSTRRARSRARCWSTAPRRCSRA